ncbi:hypothetical protein CsSME_00028050 [Camellia sinensis var. sinensis]
MQLIVSKYEPIVEEPTTPKPETTEVTKSDIEDAFYEDLDDIPTIKLNIEQFTQNLRNYMPENMELHVRDMSASIPTPKLKNVSRLRIEHHVYKLPNSDPLLKGVIYLHFCSISICEQFEKNVTTYLSAHMNFI